MNIKNVIVLLLVFRSHYSIYNTCEEALKKVWASHRCLQSNLTGKGASGSAFWVLNNSNNLNEIVKIRDCSNKEDAKKAEKSIKSLTQ